MEGAGPAAPSLGSPVPRSRRSATRRWVLLACLLALVPDCPRSAAAAAAPLFEPVENRARPAASTGSGTGWAAGGRALRWSRGPAPRTWNDGDAWSVPAPDGTSLVFRVRDIRQSGEGAVEVRGELEGDPGSEVLMANSGDMFALTLRSRAGRSFVVQPGSAGCHWVLEKFPDSEPGCGNAPGPRHEDFVRNLSRSTAARAASGASATTNIIDIGFVYTAAAEQGAGGHDGMRALIDLAVLEANDAFARSGARLQLRAVARELISYTESGYLATDLDRFGRSDGDGFAAAQRLREDRAADVMCLVVEFESGNTLAGMANMLTSLTPDSLGRGFAACVRPYLIGNYTLPHEIGHVLGCDHDRANASGSSLNAWSYGNRVLVEGAQYRTVMAYRPGIQFPYFSGAATFFRGVRTGIAEGAGACDNVRTLNLTSGLVAAVREPASRVGFDTGSITVQESAGAVRLTLSRAGRLDPASIHFSTAAGSAHDNVDFTPVSGELELPAGADRFVLEIPVLDNTTAGGPRRFSVALSTSTTNLALGPIAVTTVVIIDDESEGAAVLDSGFRSRPGADHAVMALAAGDVGTVLAGGSFTTVDGEVHPRLVRFTDAGRVDPGFAPLVKYRVAALARWPDGRILLAGEFNTVNDVRLNHAAVLRSDGGLDPGFEFDAGTDYPVLAVAAEASGRMLIGGPFTSVQGRRALHVARLERTGQPDPSFSAMAAPDGEVRAIGFDVSGRIVVGGAFRQVAGRIRPGLDRWLADGVPDSLFRCDGVADGAVNAIASDGDGNVLAAGAFRKFLGTGAGGIVRLTAAGAIDVGFRCGVGADDPILAMVITKEGLIWIGGTFSNFDARVRHRVARLHADGSLDESFDPGVGPNDSVCALLPAEDGGVLIGGVFTQVNGVDRGGIAKLLRAPPVTASFGQIRIDSGQLRWTAVAEPRQAYVLERSTDFNDWRETSRIEAGTGSFSDSEPMATEGHQFFRLHRRLE